MKDKIRVVFDRRALSFPAALECLAAEKCRGFFPAEIITEGNRVEAWFHVEGWHRLKDEELISPVQVLLLAKSVLLAVDECRDWLWFPEDYVLSLDTVFTDGKGHVRFLCIPERSKLSEYRRMENFLRALEKKTSGKGAGYLEECIGLLKEKPLHTRRLIASLDQILEEEYCLGF